VNQRHLGKYELQERLGRNVTNETWKALDTLQQRMVALKIIEVHPESEFLSRFNTEVQAVAALHHVNIVELQEAFVAPHGSEAYVVTNYVDGPSLLKYLHVTAHTGKIAAPTEIIRILTPIAAALDYAHQHRVLHGALKPTSILFDTHQNVPSLPGEPMLTDFGLHQQTDPRTLSVDDAPYIAPEVAQGHIGTERSDLYAFGIILYELCTGALPFQGETTNDILMQHIHGTPTAPALINPQIRPALTSVIMRSLAKEPSARFSSATALVASAAKALNIAMPESVIQPNLARGIITPPSFSGISGLDTMNSQTSISPLPQSFSVPSLVPPVASSNTPILPPPPISSSRTPTLSETPTALYTQPPSQTESRNTMPPEYVPVGSLHRPVTPPPPPKKRRNLFIALLVVLLLALLSSAIATFLFFTRSQLASTVQQTNSVGHAFFVSSGLVSKDSNQGVTDKLQIDLQNIGNPQSGKKYYAWLMANSGQSDIPALALGPVTSDHGHVTMTYSGALHTNLLASYSRFLITEEDASQQPVNPSLDTNTWQYYASFSTAANPADPLHFSLYNHLQHLLSQDPKLKAQGLAGGLDIWLYKNTTKILEAAGSARDQQRICAANPSTACTDFILRQVARILDYLDGSVYVHTENIPANIQDIQHGQLLIDAATARVAMLEFDPAQSPPGYLKHIGSHLQSISQISGSTQAQRTLAIHIDQAINNVQGWLNMVHADAAKLIHMNTDQLVQADALTLLNDLFVQANNAFVGQVDPNTNNVKEGVVQIHYNIQALATFEVISCSIRNGKSSCA
jgi:serine/threonine protein kinase